MCSIMQRSNVKKINKTSFFVKRIIDTVVECLYSWSRVKIIMIIIDSVRPMFRFYYS